MNDNVEFILRILLKARDEVSGDLTALKKILGSTEDDARGLNDALDGVNSNVKKISQNAKTARTRVAELAGEVKKFNEGEKGAAQIDLSRAAATETLTKATSKQQAADEKRLAAEARAERERETRAKAEEKRQQRMGRSQDDRRKDAEEALSKIDVAERRSAAATAQSEADALKAVKDARKEMRRLRTDLGVGKKDSTVDVDPESRRRIEEQQSAISDLVDTYETLKRSRLEAGQADVLDRAQRQRDIEDKLRSAAATKTETAAIEAQTVAVNKGTKTYRKVVLPGGRMDPGSDAAREVVARNADEFAPKSAEERRVMQAADRAEKVAKAQKLRAAKERQKAAEAETALSKKQVEIAQKAERDANALDLEALAHENDTFGPDDEDVSHFMSREEADPFDTFGQFGGGAPGRRENERAKAAKQLRAQDERALDKIITRFQQLSGGIAKTRMEFEKGTKSENDFIRALTNAETVLRRMSRQAGGLTSIPGNAFSDKLAARADEVHSQAEAIKKTSVSTPEADEAVAKERKHGEATERMRKSEADLRAELESVEHAWNAHNREVEAGAIGWRENAAGLKVYANELSRLSRQQGLSRSEQVRLVASADDMRSRARNLVRENENLERSTRRVSSGQERLIGGLDRTGRAFNRNSESVAALDNRLRGMLLLAVFAFAQQLITALVGLGGALFSVASSAALAGAAIGGAFTAGAATALPMIGLLVAALARLKSVMDVVKQSDLVDQQKYQRQNDNLKKQADTTDAVANAQDTLKGANDNLVSAQQRVLDSENNLTKARGEALKQRRDLIQADRESELAARGATLSQKESLDALRKSVLAGDVGGLARAELGVLDADQGVRRARNDRTDAIGERRGAARGVERQDNVVQARRQVEEARKAVVDAEAAVVKAERGIDKARRTANAAAVDSFSAAEALEFQLKKLSPAERQLYEHIKTLRETFKENFRPITDVFVGEFRRGVDTADRLLKDPRILGSAKGMAEGVVGQMERIRKEFTSSEFIDQFIRIQEQGRKHLKPITDILINFGHIFADLAEAGDKSLTKVLGYFDGLSDRIRNLTGDSKKMDDFFSRAGDHFVAWAGALEQAVILIGTLLGIADDTGMDSVNDLTQQLTNATQYVNDHREEVAQFFKDSQHVLYVILGLLWEVTKAIFDVFDPDKIDSFVAFLEKSLLPALKDVVTLVGGITSALFTLIDAVPFGNTLFKWVISLLVLSKVVLATANLFTGFRQELQHFFQLIDRATFGSFTKGLNGLKTAAGALLDVIGKLISKIPGLGKLGEAVSNAGKKFKQSPINPQGGVGSAPYGPGKKPPPGSPGIATQPGGTGPTDSRYNVLPAPRNAPSKAQMDAEERARRNAERSATRRRRVVRGAGVVGAIGAGVAATQFGTGSTLNDAGNMNALDSLSAGVKDLAGSALSLDLKGFWSALTRDDKGFKKWAQSVEDNFKKFANDKNVGGLKKLADQARKYADQFPDYAEELSKFADQAESAVTQVNDLKLAEHRQQLDLARDSVKRLWSAFDDGHPHLRDIRKAVAETTQVIKDRLGADSEEGATELGKNFRRAARQVQDAMDDGQISVKTGTAQIKRYLKLALVATGTPEQDASNIINHGVRQTHAETGGAARASGGIIGNWGERGRDLVKAWLGRGEVVLNHWQQAALNAQLPGQTTVRDVVDRVRGMHAGTIGGPLGFASGGIVPIAGQGGNGTPPGVEYISSSIKSLVESLVRRYRALITDGFDPTGTKHKSPGHEKTGTAVDFVPAAGGSWNLIEALGKWAVGKGMVVGYGAGVPGSEAWPGHGRGNHIHIEFKGGADGDVSAFPSAAKAIPKVTSRLGGTALNKIAQGALDSVRKSAMATYERLAGSQGALDAPKGSGKPAPAGQVRSWLTEALKLTKHLSAANLSKLYARTIFESGGNPKAVNNWDSNAKAGHPSMGLLQTIMSTFQSYRLKNLPNNIFNPVANAVAAIRYMFARYGGIVGSTGKGYASGGVIGGAIGKAVNIKAHAGEWIINQVQQGKLASMFGMGRDGLRAAMGFSGSNARGFAGGGEVSDDERALNFAYSSEADRNRVKRVARGQYEIPVLPLRELGDVIKELTRAGVALGNSVQAWRQRIVEINNKINELKEGGVTKEEASKIKALRVEKLNLERPAQAIKDINDKIKKLREGGVTDKEKTQIEALQAEREGVEKGRQKYASQARLGTLDALTKDGGLIDQLGTARERMTAALARSLGRATFQLRGDGSVKKSTDTVGLANQSLSNARTNLTDIGIERGTIETGLKAANDRLAALKKGGVSTSEAAEVRGLETQRANLQTRFDEIRDAQQQAIEDVFNAQVEAQQAAVDQISKKFETEQAGLDISQRIAAALGAGTEAINSARIASFTNQANELETQIAGADAIGNTELADSLRQKVVDLRTSAFEVAQQALAEAAAAIDERASRRSGRLDLFERAATAAGKVGLGGVATVAGETMTRGGVFAARAANLETQRSETQSLLGRVMTESPGNVKLIQDLTDKLADLDVTISENTKAQFDARVQEVNDIASGKIGTIDLRKQILELQGSISGVTDTEGLKKLNSDRQTALTTQRTGLDTLLQEAVKNADDKAVNDLTDQLLQNQLATLQNTQALNELNGSTTQPQTFASSAWAWFRQAIFTGMGDVIPTYTVPSAATGGIVTKSGLLQVHSGEPVIPAHIAQVDDWNTGSGDTFKFEINEAGKPIDLTKLASTVGFAKKTAQG